VPETPENILDWLDKSQTLCDEITAFPLAAMAATLDRPTEAETVPPLWHWFFFLPVSPLSEAGADGHPKRGGFLPPVPLPRRMWAGGRLTFHAPLKVGDKATRQSIITGIEDKTGRTGRLVFVTVQHEISAGGELKIEEEHDIVYRDNPAETSGNVPEKEPAKAPSDDTFSRVVETSPLLLFRYSALTFNGHRIHYDYPYVTQEDGYPGLIVHGPLIATLLVDLVHRQFPDATLATFAFRALRPTFAPNPFTVCGKALDGGRALELWAKDHDGYLTMRATATLA
jgi:3-methylfumaryl-CoA hydratase